MEGNTTKNVLFFRSVNDDTKQKNCQYLHFPEAKFGCNDFAAEQADNWGLTFALSQTPKLLHSSVLFCASLFKYLCLYFCWVIRAPNQSCLLPPISKSSIWHWLCIYVCYILFFLIFSSFFRQDCFLSSSFLVNFWFCLYFCICLFRICRFFCRVNWILLWFWH